MTASLSRRELLARLGALAAFAQGASGCARLRPPFADYPFKLGVAAGEPGPDGFVIWTRLIPDLERRTLAPEAWQVDWQVAADERFAKVVARGRATAVPDLAHSVHVEVAGLEPDRIYWYRFRAGGELSAAGRARTAPAPGARHDRLRFAFASCQHWEHGYYGAYRHLAADDPDLVVHLGDYIYEGGAGKAPLRPHTGGTTITLADYRARYALYKSDPDLQAAHAAAAWLATWDDHEVANDYAGAHSAHGASPAAFLERRAAAYQAYYEHMPLRRRSLPRGPDMRLYGRFRFGDLVEFNLLDTRQHRSDQACARPDRLGGQEVQDCEELADPARTMLGPAQEAWLEDGLARSGARWTVLAQQLLLAPLEYVSGPERRYWSDGWDGYPVARQRLLDRLAAAPMANSVVIGGDIHGFFVTDLHARPDDPASARVATEFVGTSISSREFSHDYFARALADNPHIKFMEARRRGYVLCEVDHRHWRADLRMVENARDPATGARSLARFVVEAGRPGAQRDSGAAPTALEIDSPPARHPV